MIYFIGSRPLSCQGSQPLSRQGSQPLSRQGSQPLSRQILNNNELVLFHLFIHLLNIC